LCAEKHVKQKKEKNMKLVNVLKIIGFVGTLLTSIPLFALYIKGIKPGNPMIIHLHVWLGLLFILFAVTSMVINKRNGNQNQNL